MNPGGLPLAEPGDAICTRGLRDQTMEIEGRLDRLGLILPAALTGATVVNGGEQ